VYNEREQIYVNTECELMLVNIEIFQFVSAVFIEIFKHSQQYDTLLPVTPLRA
jgi:hypothetical protein